MTAIVGVLNSRGIAIAADSAVTVSGNNSRKVYNNGNKIFTLSKGHPVGITIFNSADFMGVPLETLIKVYRKKLGDKSYPTLQEYKDDFLQFLEDQVASSSDVIKENVFFNFQHGNYMFLIDEFKAELTEKQAELLAEADLDARKALVEEILLGIVALRQQEIDSYPKAQYVQTTQPDFLQHHDNAIQQITDFITTEVQVVYHEFELNEVVINAITHLLYSSINLAAIFERYSGLVFFGFGEDELFPSSHQVLLGCPICDVTRKLIFDPIEIVPGKWDSNILPYVQGDVTNTVLTGIDPSYKETIKRSVTSALEAVSEELSGIIEDENLYNDLDQTIVNVRDKLINDLDTYQTDNFTAPLLDILKNMGKEDMVELAESLVNITSLKRKFTSPNSADESVGGPVDVAIVTKGDGFIWMKRKKYFDMDNNQDFYTKYHK